MSFEGTDQANALAYAELAQARSDLLDAFSGIEAEIAVILRAAGEPTKSSPFGQKVEVFRTVSGISQIAKANLPKRDKLADRIAALLPVRADAVHSRLRTATLDGEAVAIFLNANCRHEKFPRQRILSQADFQKLIEDANAIAAEIRALHQISPASSPPPPSPDAAGGP